MDAEELADIELELRSVPIAIPPAVFETLATFDYCDTIDAIAYLTGEDDAASIEARAIAKLIRGKPVPTPPTESWQEVFRLHLDGLAIRDALSQVFGEFDDTVSVRYAIKCRTCRDSGVVEVWSRAAIVAVVDGRLNDVEAGGYGCVPCGCPAGDGRGSASERYDLEGWCPCPRGDTKSQQNIADLKSWVEAKQQQATDRRAELGQRELWK